MKLREKQKEQIVIKIRLGKQYLQNKDKVCGEKSHVDYTSMKHKIKLIEKKGIKIRKKNSITIK